MLDGLANAIPRLQAEESLMRASEIAVGTGSLKKGEARRIVDAWQKTAGSARRSAIKPKSAAEMQMRLASLGIATRNSG